MLSFPQPSLWWFAYVALVPWMLLARSAPTGRRAAYDGWLGGLGFMLAVHHWLLPSLHVFTFVIAALLGALWAPWGWLVRRFLAGTPSPGKVVAALFVLPSGWLMAELVRSWEGLGGPWGMLGSSQWEVEAALRLASVGGVWLLSFLIVAVNIAVAVLIAIRSARVPAVAGLLATAVVTSAAWVWSPRPDVDGQVRIAVVQPGPINGVGGAEKRFAREETLTRQLAGQDVGRRLGREQRRLRPRRPARPGEPDSRALPRGGHRHHRERGRAPLRPARHIQELGGRRSRGSDRRPLRQDAAGPLR
jgi:apolipoprotein N-acyltransferase